MNYLWAGYGLTWLALAVYAWRLERRGRAAETEMSRRRPSTADDGPTDGDDPTR